VTSPSATYNILLFSVKEMERLHKEKEAADKKAEQARIEQAAAEAEAKRLRELPPRVEVRYVP